MNSGSKDLVVLIADKNMEGAFLGLLSRPQSLGLRDLSYDLYVHPERDPGCFLRGHDFLRPFAYRYSYALVIFDREGCGKDTVGRIDLERQVEQRLFSSGWNDRAAAIVIDPELEIWVWSDSPHVESALGWPAGGSSIRDWLKQRGWLPEGEIKPTQPKLAVDEALHLHGKPRSSSIYHQLAKKVGFDRCADPAFLKLRQILSRWFSR
jgi:hypothetical protein